jgi:hypothetical protein
MGPLTANSAYTESRATRFPMSLTSASRDLGITVQRLSRTIKLLQVPVSRIGYTILLDRDGYRRIQKALKNNEIKRGRKKKAS